jgi:hypothetical protein
VTNLILAGAIAFVDFEPSRLAVAWNYVMAANLMAVWWSEA